MKKIIEHLKENWIRHGFETLVVTIGILAAFTLNNWNENRKNLKLEKGFLRDINIEFKENREQFLVRNKNHNDIYEISQAMLSIFPITVDNWDSIQSILTPYFDSPITFDPTQSSIESLKNSSSFDLINDQQLKKYLISWKDQIADYKEEEEQAVKLLTDHWWPFLINQTNAEELYFNDSYNLPESSWDAFENLVFMRANTLGILVDSTIIRFNEVRRLKVSMDSIIILTEPYLDQD
jgi:hypothetical protein